jgi:hypothetical protein
MTAASQGHSRELDAAHWLVDIASKVDKLLKCPGARDYFQTRIADYQRQVELQVQARVKLGEGRRKYFEDVVQHDKSLRSKRTKRREEWLSKGWKYEEFDTVKPKKKGGKVFALPAKKGEPRRFVGRHVSIRGWVPPELSDEKEPKPNTLLSRYVYMRGTSKCDTPIEKQCAMLGAIHDALLPDTGTAYQAPTPKSDRSWDKDLLYRANIDYTEYLDGIKHVYSPLKVGGRPGVHGAEFAAYCCDLTYRSAIESYLADVEKDVVEKAKGEESNGAQPLSAGPTPDTTAIALEVGRILAPPLDRIAAAVEAGAAKQPQVGTGPGQFTDATGKDDGRPIPKYVEKAYLSYLFAQQNMKGFGPKTTDRQVYEWLKNVGMGLENWSLPKDYDLPPGLGTWKRYVRAGRQRSGNQKNTPRTGRPHGGSVVNEQGI